MPGSQMDRADQVRKAMAETKLSEVGPPLMIATDDRDLAEALEAIGYVALPEDNAQEEG